MLRVEDARFDLPALPPVPVGTSSFRGKGILYVGFQEFAARHVPGGVSAVAKQLPTPELASFLEGRFRVDAWYDLLPLPYFGAAAAKARHVAFEQQLRDANRFSVFERGGYLYSAMLKLASASMLATAIPRAASLLHDFGRASSQMLSSQHVHTERTGVPETLVRWMARSSGAYLEFALEKNGASAVLSESGARLEGERGGQRIYTLSYDIRWV